MTPPPQRPASTKTTGILHGLGEIAAFAAAAVGAVLELVGGRWPEPYGARRRRRESRRAARPPRVTPYPVDD